VSCFRPSPTVFRPGRDAVQRQHSRGDIVTAVEQVFHAIKDREDKEEELLKKLWEVVEKVAEAGGRGGRGADPARSRRGVRAVCRDRRRLRRRGAGDQAQARGHRLRGGTRDGRDDGVARQHLRLLLGTQPDAEPGFEAGAKIAQYYYNGGLALGSATAARCSAQTWGPRSGRTRSRTSTGPPSTIPDNGWGRQEWIEYYIGTATAFIRGHVTQ
jgi:hypothetical protein